jgi:hypothetical protein
LRSKVRGTRNHERNPWFKALEYPGLNAYSLQTPDSKKKGRHA